MTRFHGSLALLLALAGTGCLPGIGTDDTPEPEPTPIGFAIGPMITATIGPAGGTLETDDGSFALIVPAGALPVETTLTLTPVTNMAHGGLGSAYDLGPEGTTFAAPATVRFVLDDGVLASRDPSAVGIAHQRADGYWHWSDAAYDASARTLATETEHLSGWSMVEGVQLVPGGAVVPEGASLALTVLSCYAPPDDGSSLAPLGFRCDDAVAPLSQVDEWAVNGVPGGDATHGTIEGSGQGATFHAPARRPTPSTVRVSARVRGDALGGVVYVFSNIAIGEPHPLAGQVTVRQASYGVVFTVTYDVQLPIADDGLDETNWDAIGTATLSPTELAIGDALCTADEAEQAVDEEYFLKVRKDPQLAIRFGSVTGWPFTCRSPDGMTYPWYVSVVGRTGAGAGCIVFDDVPITDIDSIDATYTSMCEGLEPSEIRWSLRRSD